MHIVLLISLFLTIPVHAVKTNNKNFSTIYTHGLDSGPTQAAKYIPEHITWLTGETVTCTDGVNVLFEPITAPAMSEINMRNTDTDKWYSFFKQITCKITALIGLKAYGISVKQCSQPGLTLAGHGLSLSLKNIGQDADLAKLKAAYEEHKNNYTQERIMYASSNGAATTCTFICEEHPDIKAAVLEGCFDSVSNTITERYEWLLGKRGVSCAESLLQKITSWRKDGISPISVVNKWPAHVPVLFITSLKDTIVPAACTKNLVKELKENVPQALVYLLVLKNSRHPCYVFDDAQDKELYENVVHAFYKTYGIPYDAAKAERGMPHLEAIKQ